MLLAAAAARAVRMGEPMVEAAFLEYDDIDGGGDGDEIEELELVFPLDLVAMPSDHSVMGIGNIHI